MTRPLTAAALALAAGLLATTAGAARAQITTGLTPPPTPREVQRRAAAESTVAAVRDSIAVAERLDMRAWVDSAARSLEAGGSPVTPMPDVPGDTLLPRPTAPAGAAPPSPARPVPSVNPSPVVPPGGARPAPPPPTPAPTRPPSRPPTTRFEDGAPAPDTATPLPALLAAGAGLAAGGAALLRRR